MVQALLTSRKFWLTFVGVAMVVAGHYKLLDPDEITKVTALVVSLVTGIAIEDHGKGPKAIAAGGDVVVSSDMATSAEGKDPTK